MTKEPWETQKQAILTRHDGSPFSKGAFSLFLTSQLKSSSPLLIRALNEQSFGSIDLFHSSLPWPTAARDLSSQS